MKRKQEYTTQNPELQPVVLAEFQRLAGSSGVIGAPDGEPAYGYLRVSSDGQAEEGRSGLPRQLANVAEAAWREGYAITLERIFSDDHTGFEFEGRPALTALRLEFKNGHRRANVIIMEHLDRLSRNADWHQGFLLDEMKRAGVKAVFWKTFHSRIERMVLGAASQDGMEQTIERMTEGTRRKAREGRVTSHNRAYGYLFAGKDGVPRPSAGKDTTYVPHPTEAPVVQRIFSDVASGHSLRSVAAKLNETVPPAGKAKLWTQRLIHVILKNTVYKGEFAACRFRFEKVRRPDGTIGQRVTERPKDEWIIVPVPPLVDSALWEAANAMLAKNKATAARRGKGKYLLTGMVKCASCGCAVCGRTIRPPHRQNSYIAYTCNSVHTPGWRKCSQGYVLAVRLETAVWAAVCSALNEPERLIEALRKEHEEGPNGNRLEQIAFLEEQIERIAKADERDHKAYLNGDVDLEEFSEGRKARKVQTAKLLEQKRELEAVVNGPQVFEAQKALILRTAAAARRAGIGPDTPLSEKKQILKSLVDRIDIDVEWGLFRLHGAISGTFSLTPGEFVYISDTGDCS